VTVRQFDPYTITLHPGKNAEAVAGKVARYIVDQWMPGNAGGVHLIVTPRLTKCLVEIYKKMTTDTRIRVSLEGNVPLIEVVT
jgi:hypothetical protein